MCRTYHRLWLSYSGSRSHFKVMWFTIQFACAPYLQFSLIFLSARRCAWPIYLYSMSRSQVKDMVFILEFLVWLLWAIFIKFRCAEPMTRLCKLKVKVTHQGQVIYHSVCVCFISPEPFEQFSLNFTEMFLSERWCADCRARDTAT